MAEPISDEKPFDPYSAFIIATQNLTNESDPRGHELALAILNNLVQIKFPPAIVLLSRIIIESKQQDPNQLIPDLVDIIDNYHFGPAGTILGNIYSILDRPREAIEFLEKGIKEGEQESELLLALYLNPNENPDHSLKDFKRSEELLLKLAPLQIPRVFVSLALLYSETDPPKAREYLSKARAIDPSIKNIEIPDKPRIIGMDSKPEDLPQKHTPEPPTIKSDKKTKKEISPITKVAIGVVGVTGLAALGAFIFNVIRKSKSD